jgi:hypothetical protein
MNNRLARAVIRLLRDEPVRVRRRLLLDVHNLAHRPYAIFAIGGCGENVAARAHRRTERGHAAQEMSSCQTRHLAHLFAP